MATWRGRRCRHAAPVLLIVLYPGNAALCGASGEQPPIYPEVDPGQAKGKATKMPMQDEEKREKVQRLVTAYNKTKKTLERDPVSREWHAGTDIARNWPVITAAYSGLEQTIKYLIAEEKNLSILELMNVAARGNAEANEGGDRRHPYRTHNLAWLFSKLEQATQDVMRDFYGRFQSLHTYITAADVDEFLNEVSGPRGAGYGRWRYSLIEDRQLPRNSPEGLVAIWGACTQIAEERIWENQQVRMLDEELTDEFGDDLESAVLYVSGERQNAGEPFQDIDPEIRAWLRNGGHPLNAFADVLWHFDRYDWHGVAGASAWFSDALTL